MASVVGVVTDTTNGGRQNRQPHPQIRPGALERRLPEANVPAEVNSKSFSAGVTSGIPPSWNGSPDSTSTRWIVRSICPLT